MTLLLHWNEREYAEETASIRSLPQAQSTLVVATDFSQPSLTVSAIVEARRRGATVALYPIMADPLQGVLEQVGAAIARQPDEGQRFIQLLALRDGRLNVNQKPLHEAAQFAPDVLAAAVLCVKLCDVLLCFTAAEKDRWSALIGRPVRRFAYLPAPRLHRAPDRGGLAVYAPGMADAQLALIALALQERRLSAEFVNQPQAQIPGSAVIVPQWWRPGRILSLAAAGYAVISPALGAADARCGCATYRPEDVFSFGAAVDAAQSTAVGLRFDVDARSCAGDIEAAAVPDVRGPRVSVIVRTYDRPALLARALASIAAQTYHDIEIVVVNNGGPGVEAIVRKSCGARAYRYVTLAVRAHISAASNAGAREASGTYVGYLDDDDVLYPDHFARAVEALEHSRADLAYTNCIAEYARVEGESKHILGFQIFRDNEFCAKDLYLDNVAPIHSIVHRRDVFERFGYFDESLPVTDDWEMWLRASRGSRFLHVDRVTCEYSWRFDPARGNMTLTHQRQFAESYEAITSRYGCDVAAIPSIAAQQLQVKAAQKQRADQLAQLGPRMAELTVSAMAQNAVAAQPVPFDPFA